MQVLCIIVPRVLMTGHYIGGPDEVRRLHKDGKLGCPDCNENGLIRCLVCFQHHFTINLWALGHRW
uniref:Uncharacterized protein n=1 Tax=Physcomitrium patens TaxID=3218 RepID=A0A2K1K728_PHYPA|nr:hypothetical protein PHYPA_011489 [Physcomitrium patens]